MYLITIMKKSLLVIVAVAAAVFVVVTGCETEKLSDAQLTVSPAKTTIEPGNSVVLTAQGGWDYTWDAPQHGTLSTYNGKKVTYYAPEASSVESGSSTNGFELTDKVVVHSASNHTATAIIIIKSEGTQEE